jgi:hypothetical protein
MSEKSPAEEFTRDEPMVIWADGAVKLEVFAESGGVASVAGDNVARIRNPQWIVRVHDVERGGWGEATIYQTLAEVQTSALRWWEGTLRAQTGE